MMTLEKRKAFLGELATSGSVAFACEAAQTTRAAAYDERDSDPRFERAWRTAEQRARDRFGRRLSSAVA